MGWKVPSILIPFKELYHLLMTIHNQSLLHSTPLDKSHPLLPPTYQWKRSERRPVLEDEEWVSYRESTHCFTPRPILHSHPKQAAFTDKQLLLLQDPLTEPISTPLPYRLLLLIFRDIAFWGWYFALGSILSLCLAGLSGRATCLLVSLRPLFCASQRAHFGPMHR